MSGDGGAPFLRGCEVGIDLQIWAKLNVCWILIFCLERDELILNELS